MTNKMKLVFSSISVHYNSYQLGKKSEKIHLNEEKNETESFSHATKITYLTHTLTTSIR